VQPPPYLDHQATTPCDPPCRGDGALLSETFANPAAACHRPGLGGGAAVERARQQLGFLLGVGPEQVVFPAGATEAKTTWPSRAWPRPGVSGGRHLVPGCLAAEPPGRARSRAILAAYRLFELTVLARRGRWPGGTLEQLEAEPCADTVLVSVMGRHNEIGVSHPLPPIAAPLSPAGHPPFTVTAPRPSARSRLQPAELGIDLAQPSAATRSNGPKGIGALVIDPSPDLAPTACAAAQEGVPARGNPARSLIVGAGGGRELAMAVRPREPPGAARRPMSSILQGLICRGVCRRR